MPCLWLIFAFISPRIVLAILWLTGWVQQAVASPVYQVLGFLFAPATTLAYCWAKHANGAVDGVWWAVLAVGVMLDLGVMGGASRKKRRE